MSANENLSPMVMVKLMKELRKLVSSPPEGIHVMMSEDNVSNIVAEIEGPVETPFHGGVFGVRLVLGPDFPNAPPKAFFLTKIFHPNVSESGEVCVNTLKRDWKPTHGIEHVLLVIRCLLIIPNPESALNPEAGRLLLDHYEDFARRAKMMTRIHAKSSVTGKKKKSRDSDDDALGSSSSSSSSSGKQSPTKKQKSKGKDKKKSGRKKKGLKRL